MWHCVKCRESVEDTFDVCWNCGTDNDGTEDPMFCKEDDSSQFASEPPQSGINCLRCNQDLSFVGTKKFHEGSLVFDVIGGFGELFKNREHFDVYMCPRCGRMEFFAHGIGEEFRLD